MATLKHAFNAKDMNSLVYKILRGKVNTGTYRFVRGSSHPVVITPTVPLFCQMPQMPKVYSPELIELIKAMLHQNPDKRPSVNRVLRDPYIKKNIAVFLEGTIQS